MKTSPGIFLFVAMLLATDAYTQDDPFQGAWVLNVEQSNMMENTFSTSETVIYRIFDDTETYTSDATTANGEREVTQYSGRYNDDQEYPVTVTLYGETISARTTTLMLRRIDTSTRERIHTRDGQITAIMQRVLSEDGRTITSSVMIPGSDGDRTTIETRVFEKQ